MFQPAAEIVLWYKVCATCKENLSDKCYFSHARNQYSHCKRCENKRLALHRKHQRAVVAEYGDAMKICDACLNDFPMRKIIMSGIFKGRICKKCNYKMNHHKDPHRAVIVNGKCDLCEVYGKSDKCMVACSNDDVDFVYVNKCK